VFSGFCVDRLVLSASLAALALLQDVPITRQVDLTISEGTSMAAAASPDRQSIAIDLLGGIWILPFRGGEARRITPELLEARQPTWSPDGQSIAFQGSADGTWHIYVIGRDGGEAKAITSGVFDDREPAWSHDGSRIAFSSDRYGGITTIWDVEVASGDVHQVSTRDGWMPTWSPGDQGLTFVSLDRIDPRRQIPALYSVDNNGHERLLVPAERDRAADTTPVAAAWSADGTQLAYVTRLGRLLMGTHRLVTPFGDAFTAAVSISGAQEEVFPFKPQWISATEILYTSNGRIMRRAIGGRASAIPFTAKGSLLSLIPI